MSELSPKELDKLLQDGSEQYDFEYNPEAWAQMETLLEKDRRRRLVWWWFSGAGILLLAVAIGFWWKMDSENLISQPTAPTHEQPAGQNQKIESSVPNKTFLETETIENQPLKNTGTLEKNRPLLTTPETPVLKKENAAETMRFDSAQRPSAQRPFAQHPTVQNYVLENVRPDTSLALARLLALPFAVLEMDSKNLPTLRLPDLVSENGSLRETKQHKDIAFLVGLSVNAETASAGLDRFSKPNNIGIGGHLEVRYAGKFSTGIGVQYIRIKYEAGAGKYLPASDFWIGGIEPESTEATCKILEVPVWLGYYPKGYSQSGFYAKIGLSSYFMLKEYYHYNYAVYDPNLLTGWGEKNNYRHWFGIGLVSVGYNQMLGRKTSMQIAPYLQIPLTGVGHGEIKLWSAGLSLACNFQVN
ncbi:MAG: hypothetical protein ACKV1O_09510 [Saprospiraceae bacterium]